MAADDVESVSTLPDRLSLVLEAGKLDCSLVLLDTVVPPVRDDCNDVVVLLSEVDDEVATADGAD